MTRPAEARTPAPRCDCDSCADRPGLMRRFANAMGPGEPEALMRSVAWALICGALLVAIKVAPIIWMAAPALLWGSR